MQWYKLCPKRHDKVTFAIFRFFAAVSRRSINDSIALPLHTHFFNRSNIYLLSSTGKRWKTISRHFVRLLLQLGAAQHWPFDIQRRADAIVCSVARLKLDGASDCGVTRYREKILGPITSDASYVITTIVTTITVLITDIVTNVSVLYTPRTLLTTAVSRTRNASSVFTALENFDPLILITPFYPCFTNLVYRVF